MRTFSQSDWLAADAAWSAGGFGAEWAEVRRQAAGAGLLYPPTGHADDPIDVDHPSQAAILARAIDEAPSSLADAISRSPNWLNVVGLMLADRDRRRAEIAAEEAAWAATKRRERLEAERVLVGGGS